MTGVGAILRRFGCGSSCSASFTSLLSLFPKVAPAVEAATLEVDIGVIGGVDNGRPPETELEAVIPGTVPMVGVGELPIIGAVGGA